MKQTLDSFVRNRAQSLGRLVSRPEPGVEHGYDTMKYPGIVKPPADRQGVAATRVLEVVMGGKTNPKEGINEEIEGATPAKAVPEVPQVC